MVPHEEDNSMSKAVGEDKSSVGENVNALFFFWKAARPPCQGTKTLTIVSLCNNQLKSKLHQIQNDFHAKSFCSAAFVLEGAI